MAELPGQPKDYFNIGGMDTISSSVRLGPTKLRDSQNINLFPVGGYQWRNGYTTLNSTAVSTYAVNGLYQASFSAAGNVAIMVCGNKVYTMPSSLNGTWTDVTNGVSLTAGNNNVVNFAILNDTVVMCNDTDTTLQMNSSQVVAVLAGSPAFTSSLFCLEHYGYMFYGQTVEGGTRQYDRLRFSDINAPNTFTMLGSNNYIDVGVKQGGDLRGAVSYRGNLYCFKKHGIYNITFQPTRVNSSGVTFPFSQFPIPTVPRVGTRSYRSIVKFTTPITNRRQSGAELVFFIDQYGIPRIFDGTTSVQIGYPISQSRDSAITSLSNMDRTMLPYVWAVNYPERNQILCFISNNNSLMDTCWKLDYTSDFDWTRDSFYDKFLSGALFEKSTGKARLFFGNYSGKAFEYDTTTADNGIAISSYATHGDAYSDSPVINGKWPWIEFKGSTSDATQTFTLSAYKNGEDSPSVVVTGISLANSNQTTWGTTGTGGTMRWASSNWAKSGLATLQKELALDAKTLRIKLSNSTLNNTLSLEGFSLPSIPQGISQL